MLNRNIFWNKRENLAHKSWGGSESNANKETDMSIVFASIAQSHTLQTQFQYCY